MLIWYRLWLSLSPSRVQEPGVTQTLDQLLEAGPEAAVLLLSFTLAIFVALVFAVRALMIFRKLPVPIDPLDMAKPRAFRAVMLAGAAVLAPLVASPFLPELGLDSQATLVVLYACQLLIVVLLWFLLDLFYRRREQRAGKRD
jgi:hypothetical protein